MNPLISIRPLVALIAAFAMFPASADETSTELELVRQKVAEMFDMIGEDDVSVSPVDGWYTVHKGSIVA